MEELSGQSTSTSNTTHPNLIKQVKDQLHHYFSTFKHLKVHIHPQFFSQKAEEFASALRIPKEEIRFSILIANFMKLWKKNYFPNMPTALSYGPTIIGIHETPFLDGFVKYNLVMHQPHRYTCNQNHPTLFPGTWDEWVGERLLLGQDSDYRKVKSVVFILRKPKEYDPEIYVRFPPAKSIIKKVDVRRIEQPKRREQPLPKISGSAARIRKSSRKIRSKQTLVGKQNQLSKVTVRTTARNTRRRIREKKIPLHRGRKRKNAKSRRKKPNRRSKGKCMPIKDYVRYNKKKAEEAAHFEKTGEIQQTVPANPLSSFPNNCIEVDRMSMISGVSGLTDQVGHMDLSLLDPTIEIPDENSLSPVSGISFSSTECNEMDIEPIPPEAYSQFQSPESLEDWLNSPDNETMDTDSSNSNMLEASESEVSEYLESLFQQDVNQSIAIY